MLLPLYLGVLHAVEPDHVAVVTGVSLAGKGRGAWKVGLAFGASHMLAMAILAVVATFLGQTFFGDGFFRWMDRLAWTLVLLLGLWNLAAALGLRRISTHSHTHRHGPLEHEHPHPHQTRRPRKAWTGNRHPARRVHGYPLLRPFPPLVRTVSTHRTGGHATHAFHHAAAWMGAFFGLGGLRGFTSLMRNTGISGQVQFIEALLLFGLGITAMFMLLSAVSGWVAARFGPQLRFHRALYALSGAGNVAVGLYLLFKA